MAIDLWADSQGWDQFFGVGRDSRGGWESCRFLREEKIAYGMKLVNLVGFREGGKLAYGIKLGNLVGYAEMEFLAYGMIFRNLVGFREGGKLAYGMMVAYIHRRVL